MYAVLALVVGVTVGLLTSPTVPDWLGPYLPIAVVAALDAVLGGLRARLDAELGIALGVGAQLSTAVVVVLGIRIFGNTAAIRRHFFKA